MLKALSKRSFIHLARLCFFIDLFKFSVSRNVLSSPKLSVCIAGLNDLTADFKMLVFETDVGRPHGAEKHNSNLLC